LKNIVKSISHDSELLVFLADRVSLVQPAVDRAQWHCRRCVATWSGTVSSRLRTNCTCDDDERRRRSTGETMAASARRHTATHWLSDRHRAYSWPGVTECRQRRSYHGDVDRCSSVLQPITSLTGQQKLAAHKYYPGRTLTTTKHNIKVSKCVSCL